jgi:hypothetical protein
MARISDYHLVDPTAVEVNPSHVICKGQCPRCKVFWSERPDQSCDCFVPGSQADDRPKAWEMQVRRVVMEVIAETLSS